MSYFIVFYTIVSVGLFLYFIKIKSSIVTQHSRKILSLEQEISMHKTQIKFRYKGLQKYNFQIYNLNDSLRVQSEIKLN